MTRTRILIVILAAALAGSAVAVAQGPDVYPRRGPTVGRTQFSVQLLPKEPVDPRAELIGKFNQADLVFTGTVASVQQGPTARSYPPIYSMKIKFADVEALKGKPEAQAVYHYRSRQKQPPKVDVGTKMLVAAKARPGQAGAFSITKMVPADDRNVQLAKTAVSLPVGWSIQDGKPLSPFAKLGAKAWPKKAKPTAKLVCVKTGRPGLRCGEGVTFKVESLPPAVKIKWRNEYGDGIFKITVTNTTKKPVEVPALLADESGKILWAKSLVILHRGKSHLLPAAGEVPESVKPATIKPGESVSGEINSLKLADIPWPRGGSRVHLRFCLGERSGEAFFYYYSKHHDKLRGAARAEENK